MDVEMDPSDPSPDPEAAEDETLIMGTVSDADTAEPVAGARISVIGSSLAEETTATGEFTFALKTGPADSLRRPTVTLEAEAKNYRSLRMKNIPLAGGNAIRLPVRLERKTSDTEQLAPMEEDHWRNPGADFLADWVFDVTIR